MTNSEPEPHPTAWLRLRGRHGRRVPVTVRWTAGAGEVARVLVVAGPHRLRDLLRWADQDIHRWVVLEVPCTDELPAVLAWAAGHAGDLGAVGDVVFVTGFGPGEKPARAAARVAAADGWPVVRLLLHPSALTRRGSMTFALLDQHDSRQLTLDGPGDRPGFDTEHGAGADPAQRFAFDEKVRNARGLGPEAGRHDAAETETGTDETSSPVIVAWLAGKVVDYPG